MKNKPYKDGNIIWFPDLTEWSSEYEATRFLLILTRDRKKADIVCTKSMAGIEIHDEEILSKANELTKSYTYEQI